MVFGKPCDCTGCVRPVLAPGNYQAWEIYKILASPFGRDLGMNMLELLRGFGVHHPIRTLHKLNLIHEIARENAKRMTDADGQ